jgi:hypothetical protein
MPRIRARSRQAGRSKYRAVKVSLDGVVFASKAEGRRYGELKLLEKAGEIRGLVLQPHYPLFVKPLLGVMVPIGEYIADFSYEERVRDVKADLLDTKGWRAAVEDVKGFRTPLYRWKKKHVEAQYGIQIREVR